MENNQQPETEIDRYNINAFKDDSANSERWICKSYKYKTGNWCKYSDIEQLQKQLSEAKEETALIKSKADKLAGSTKLLLHYHICEQEGILSGQPTPAQWFDSVNNLANALSEYKGGENE